MAQTPSTVMRHVIAALVTNEPGVLAQVAGMFAARGFNIDSLVVGRTETPDISRMTIVVVGDDAVLEQVRKQLQKLVPVVKVVDYQGVAYVERDLVLVQVSTADDKGHGAARRSELIQLVNLFRARIVDVSPERLMIELAGTEDKIEAFINLVQPYGIVELARTGVIAMPRGSSGGGQARLAMSVPPRHRKGKGRSGGAGGGDVDASSLPPG
jgi:acetolactate synthase-1/3 small subunit